MESALLTFNRVLKLLNVLPCDFCQAPCMWLHNFSSWRLDEGTKEGSTIYSTLTEPVIELKSVQTITPYPKPGK